VERIASRAGSVRLTSTWQIDGQITGIVAVNTVTWQRGCKVLSTILGVWSFFSSWPIKSLIECLIKSCQPDCCSDALSSISYETLECKLLQMDTNMACCCLRHWRRMNRRWSPRWVGPQQDESTGKWTTLCSAVENEWCFVS
jgi:hypothetical protein